MDLSIFLAKVIGLYMLSVGLIALKKPGWQEITNEFSRNNSLRFTVGLFVLIIGIILVTSHNIWGGLGYQVLITLIAWLILIKGFLTLWLSDQSYRKIITKFNTKNIITIAGVLNLIAGVYLTYIGFFI